MLTVGKEEKENKYDKFSLRTNGSIYRDFVLFTSHCNRVLPSLSKINKGKRTVTISSEKNELDSM